MGPLTLSLSQMGEGICLLSVTQGGATASLTLGYNHVAPKRGLGQKPPVRHLPGYPKAE